MAYVFASVDPKQWHGIYTTFKDIPEIKEASLIYGSSTVDAIIKIEAPTRKFNEVLIGTISDHPHIKTTQTLFAVSGSQWQKSQLERDAQLEDIPFYHSDAIQDDLTTPAVHADSLYPSPQIKRLFQKEEQNKQLDIEDMRHGDLVIKPEASINLFPEIVTESAQQSIRAVVILDKIGRGEKVRLHRYLQAQAMKKSHHPDFEIRRVFFFNDLEAQLKKAEICARLGYELAIGVQVKYLRAWCNVHQNDGPWDFGLMDETMQWIMENKTNYESIRHLRVSLNRTTVQRTARYFEIIWSNAEAFNSSQITPFHQAYLESDFVKWTPS
ncbi:MAG: Lrp/AsnC ligand binding domain-containing protein [Candidatus Competibacteraceae bacterium]|nr:Lrp/AsnC ligand binding domain-containing protein [Candidatus Competibacteraceae bacterium]